MEKRGLTCEKTRLERRSSGDCFTFSNVSIYFWTLYIITWRLWMRWWDYLTVKQMYSTNRKFHDVEHVISFSVKQLCLNFIISVFSAEFEKEKNRWRWGLCEVASFHGNSFLLTLHKSFLLLEGKEKFFLLIELCQLTFFITQLFPHKKVSTETLQT